MVKLFIKKALAVVTAIAMAVFCAADLQAQNKSLTGTVVDASGQPVIGAAVLLLGASGVGTETDLDGHFVLSVPENGYIMVSCIGYADQSLSVAGQNNIRIVLQEDTELLEETVVIGYGVQRKSDVTGSVASVKGDDFLSRSTSNAAAALQGKASGVQILTTSGAPGGGSSIRVRGYSSNSGNLGPLLIVDGLKVSDINYLDPEMIESMEILKDAASAAIYGAQAGNGVILITTKNGASNNGRSSVTYSMKLTDQFLGPVDAYITDPDEYIDYVRRRGGNIDSKLEQYGYKPGDGDNWFKETFEPTWSKQHSLTVQGGNNNGHFLASLNYVDDNGIVKGDYDVHERMGAQINADYNIYKWLTVGTNVSVTRTKTKSVSQQANFGSLFGAVVQTDPLTPFYYKNPEDFKDEMYTAYLEGQTILGDENGYYATSKYSGSPAGHPFIQRDRNKNQYGTNLNINGNLYANITPVKGLVFTTRFGSRVGQSNSHNFTEPYFGTSAMNGGFSTSYTVSANVNTSVYYQWENFANYNFNLGKNAFGLMAGMSYTESTSDNASISATDVDPMTGYEPNFQYINYVKSDITKNVSNAPSRSSSLAYFARFTYAYDNRYNFQANFRADAFDSSKLSKESRWGYFPSFSAGWTISNESFVKDNVSRDVLSFLKLRASWGRNGNINVLSGYPYDTTISLNSAWYQYQVGSGDLSLGSSPNGIANPGLKWETSDQIDLGLDARFLNNKLTFAADWFIKDTRGLLLSIPLPKEVGVNSVMKNAGSIRNSGLELELGWKDTIGDFTYSINGNLSFLKNLVTYIDPLVGRTTSDKGGVSGTDNPIHKVFEEGYPIWYFEGYKYAGTDPATGDYTIEDVNNDGQISDTDMTYIGSSLPDYTYGITLNMAWKGFDFTLFGTGVGGNEIFNCVSRAGDQFRNGLRYVYLNSWSESNKNAEFPDPLKCATDWHFWGSSACIFSGAYFKIKQMQLGYTLPSNIVKKIKLSNIRLYVSADDMITLTKYPGLDPETATVSSGSSMGFDAGGYPIMKKFMIGANITF